MWNQKLIRKGIKVAKQINAQHGTSYYFANKLFPKQIQKAVHVLYAFFRIPDNIVDTNTDAKLAAQKLTLWEKKWEQAYLEKSEAEPVLYASSYIFHQYAIPWEYSVAFFAAMKQDLTKSTYDTYAELEQYMYGSAAVVGLMLTHVIGFNDKKALGFAADLGYAMQLTNFLRDIKEDYIERRRVYMPQTELREFGLTSKDISNENFTPAFDQFMQFQIARARQLYRSADEGIMMLAPKGQLAVRVASKLYEAILTKIEQQARNIFLGRARTSKWEKLQLLWQARKQQSTFSKA